MPTREGFQGTSFNLGEIITFSPPFRELTVAENLITQQLVQVFLTLKHFFASWVKMDERKAKMDDAGFAK